MTRIPRKIEVLGVTFKVSLVDKVDADHSYGETHGVNRTIKLQRDLTAEQLEAVFAHELSHAILQVSGITEQLSPKLEEAIVTAFEHALPQLYQRRLRRRR